MATQIENTAQKPPIEEKIVDLLFQQDKEAIRLIFENYGPVLMNIITRVVKYEAVAQDVMQEALLKIWKNGITYNREKGSLFTWMTRICRNAAIDKTRSKDYRLTETSMNAVDLVSITDTPQDLGSMEEPYMRELIEQLPSGQKELINLAYFQGYTHKEISENLEIPLGTVKTRIRSAISKLRTII
ncbi:MAG: sigma-70 family RNA polymerase sigma factor [Bacteroidota bacterium]